VKSVVSRFNGRVGGENARLPGFGQGQLEGKPFGHLLPDEFQDQKGRMALVEMEDEGSMLSARSRRTPPMPRSISCKMRVVDRFHKGAGSDHAIAGRFPPGRCREKDGNASDVDSPGPKAHGQGRQGHRADIRLPFRIQDGIERQIAGLEGRIGFDLPVGMIHALGEISLAVEKAEADKIQAQIAGRLGMVGGQDSQSPAAMGSVSWKPNSALK